jgi:hypothetical protein
MSEIILAHTICWLVLPPVITPHHTRPARRPHGFAIYHHFQRS